MDRSPGLVPEHAGAGAGSGTVNCIVDPPRVIQPQGYRTSVMQANYSGCNPHSLLFMLEFALGYTPKRNLGQCCEHALQIGRLIRGTTTEQAQSRQGFRLLTWPTHKAFFAGLVLLLDLHYLLFYINIRLSSGRMAHLSRSSPGCLPMTLV